MNRPVTFMFVILFLNLVIALVYLLFMLMHKKEKSRSCIYKTVIMLLCPVVGPLFFGLSFLIFKLFLSEPVDLNDVVFSKDRVKTYVHPDEERERNMVPLEEAIEIMDKENLRGVMMNVIRKDFQKSLTAISLALNSEDTETAHYAASVLQDALNHFRDNVEKQYAALKEEDRALEQVNSDADCTALALKATELLDYMNEVLRQKVFTEIEQKSLTAKMNEVGQILFKRKSEEFTPALYEKLCMRLLETQDYEECAEWCNRATQHYPDTLSTYTCQLKLYFACGEKEKFFEVMNDLKHSAVVIDNETLELLRVFM